MLFTILRRKSTAEAPPELKLAMNNKTKQKQHQQKSMLTEKKKKSIHSKRKTKENNGLLLHAVGHLTNKDITNKAETLKAFPSHNP